jgi:hypothetical protein
MGVVQIHGSSAPKAYHWPRFGQYTVSPQYIKLAVANPVIKLNLQEFEGGYVGGVCLPHHGNKWGQTSKFGNGDSVTFRPFLVVKAA